MASAEDQVMTVRNIQTVKSWNDTFNRGDIEAAAAYFSEDTRNFGRQVGREGLRRVLEDIHQTFPDWKMEIVDAVAVADSVVIRCKVSATHLGVGTAHQWGTTRRRSSDWQAVRSAAHPLV